MLRICPRQVNSARALVQWALRVAAMVLSAWGGYLVAKRLIFAVLQGGGLFDTLQAYQGVGDDDALSRGTGMLLIAGTLAALARPISRWVVSVPEEGCPRCGYKGAVNDTCPECGQPGMSGR